MMADTLNARQMTVLFRALSDPRRLAILSDLAKRDAPARVSDLTSCCGIDFSGVSRHLKILRDAGLVTSEKRGRETLYALQSEPLATALEKAAKAFRRP
jgi:DNA-binding transcriptional ArsR family regulator